MRVTWEVEDGYIGKSRPQHTEIPEDELAECENDDDRERLIEEYIQEDFDNIITWAEVSRENN